MRLYLAPTHVTDQGLHIQHLAAGFLRAVEVKKPKMILPVSRDLQDVS